MTEALAQYPAVQKRFQNGSVLLEEREKTEILMPWTAHGPYFLRNSINYKHLGHFFFFQEKRKISNYLLSSQMRLENLFEALFKYFTSLQRSPQDSKSAARCFSPSGLSFILLLILDGPWKLLPAHGKTSLCTLILSLQTYTSTTVWHLTGQVKALAHLNSMKYSAFKMTLHAPYHDTECFSD